MTETVDAVVVGAGVVGLAIARALALDGREVIVLEAADSIGTETSSRNSEVIHAGIYYPTGSLKARFCVEGRDKLYRFCAEHGVPHRRCGKLIVATDSSQLPGMEKLRAIAAANGAGDLAWLSAEEAKTMEPQLSCIGALHSPLTGIIDSHSYMLALQGDAEERGAMIAFLSPVTDGHVGHNAIEIEVGGAEPMRIRCRTLVNSGGLHAQALSKTLEGLDPATVPPAYLAKGNYYVLTGVKPPFTRLIYPAPEQAGLGIHVTLDLAGQMKFGPDVEWVNEITYDVDPRRAESFYAAIRTYWPGLPDGALSPGYAGMRPKLQKPGEPAKDFMVQGPRETGIPGLVSLYGIESPGLTASLAIADHVVELLRC
ncbi:MAG: NAD(P)/FAD-dependent oxidoreductase [Alphaproteobacteria bacterium]|nr:NAD(P)/FAD-dependent oxidoreductase [Alphaproteobacteria bacterium]